MIRTLCRLPSPVVSLLTIMPKSEQWFYAVRKGKTPGIYFKWSDCESQVKGFTGAVYKKFPLASEAADFALGKATEAKRAHSNSPEKDEPVEKKSKVVDSEEKVAVSKENSFTGAAFSEEEGVHVYTDGGCFFNGQAGAQAGIGVFWNKDDPDNVSAPLSGRPSNNRAEIHAAVRAVKIAKKKGIENLILHTDSQFLINGITKWIKGWKKRGWKLSTGGPVVNKEDFEELDESLQGLNVKWVYVKGHSGNAQNDAVDALAKQGARKAAKQ